MTIRRDSFRYMLHSFRVHVIHVLFTIVTVPSLLTQEMELYDFFFRSMITRNLSIQ